MATKKHLLAVAVTALLTVGTACVPDPQDQTFPAHCWETLLQNADMPEHATVTDNFPTTCEDKATGNPFLPDHPPAGFFVANGCPANGDPALNSAIHYLTKSFIPKHKASETYTSDELAGYQNTKVACGSGARASCEAYLTCNGSPGSGCDVDSDTSGDQSCTISDAHTLCETCNGSPGSGCDVDSDTSGDQSCTISDAHTLCETWAEDPVKTLMWSTSAP